MLCVFLCICLLFSLFIQEYYQVPTRKTRLKYFIRAKKQSTSIVDVLGVKTSMENYTKLRIIGTGSFGTVWLIRSKDKRRNYVLKEISLSIIEERQRSILLNEVKVLSQLRHMNIIRYKEAFLSNGFLCISMEYAQEGS